MSKNKQNFTVSLVKSLMSLPGLHIILVGPEGIIIDYSQAIKTLFGFIDSDVINKLNIQKVLPKLYFRDLLKKSSDNSEISIKSEIIWNDIRFYSLITIKPIENTCDFIVFFNELIKIDQLNPLVKKNILEIKSISKMLSSSLDLNMTLKLILDDLREVVNYDYSAIMYIDGDNLNIIELNKDKGENKLPNKINLTVDSTLFNYIKISKTIIINNCFNDNPLIQALNINNVKQLVLLPLTIQDSFFGLMAIFNEKNNNYSINDLNFLKLLALISTNLIKNAELRDIFQLQLKNLKESVIEKTKTVETIKIQNQKVLEADRMKNEFLAHMSHELRTPLNAIIGFSEALKLKFFGELTPKQEEYINDIHESGIHLLGMINDMLDLSKIESKKMELILTNFQIELAVNEVINIVLALANKKNICINKKFDHKKENITADHKKFQQILFNLLSNAIKYTSDGGSIDLITKNTTLKTKQALSLTIKDSGIGISKQDQQRIFQKFQQVDNSYNRNQSGSGLGLTITKELIEKHNGKILVESELNKGSAFTVILPFAQDNLK